MIKLAEDLKTLSPSCQRNKDDPWPLNLYSLGKKSSLYLFVVSHKWLPSTLSYLNSTITSCPDKVDPGTFKQENILLFLVSGRRNSTEIKRSIFSDKNIRMHDKVAVLQNIKAKSSRKDQKVSALWRYDIYSDTVVHSVLDLDNEKENSMLFSPFKMKVSIWTFS